MDRNTVLALILIGFILIIFSIVNRPPPPEPVEERVEREEVAEEEPETQERETREIIPDEDSPESPQRTRYPEPFNAFESGDEDEVVLENEFIKLVFTSKGGGIKKAVLKDYVDYEGNPVKLFNTDDKDYAYLFHYQNTIVSTADLYFELDGDEGFVREGESKSVKMLLPVDDGVTLEKTFTLTGSGYLVDHQINWTGFDRIIPRNINYIDIAWQSQIPRHEFDLEDERNATTVYYKYLESSPTYLSERGSDETSFTARSKWVSFKQKFFTQTLIADESFFRGKVKSVFPEEDVPYVKELSAELELAYDHEANTSYDFTFYLGPNKYSELRAVGYNMERQVPMGWLLFRYVNQYLVLPLFNYFGSFFESYGWIIFFLTLVIKLITMPLTWKSYMSMAKMRLLKPDIEEIKEKHEGDMQKQQQEQMKLYRKAGVNPLSGCVPMLLQLPILVSLFMFFPSSIELRHESFLWATDLSTYDVFYRFPNDFSIPFYGNHVSMFALLMAISTLFYTLMNNQFSGAQKEMKYVAIVVPFFLLFIFNSFSAGLTYYYFLFNVLSIGQQFMFKGIVDENKLKAKIEENKKKPVKKSKFQMKLEEMQKKQEQIQKQRKEKGKSGKARKNK